MILICMFLLFFMLFSSLCFKNYVQNFKLIGNKTMIIKWENNYYGLNNKIEIYQIDPLTQLKSNLLFEYFIENSSDYEYIYELPENRIGYDHFEVKITPKIDGSYSEYHSTTQRWPLLLQPNSNNLDQHIIYVKSINNDYKPQNLFTSDRTKQWRSNFNETENIFIYDLQSAYKISSIFYVNSTEWQTNQLTIYLSDNQSEDENSVIINEQLEDEGEIFNTVNPNKFGRYLIVKISSNSIASFVELNKLRIFGHMTHVNILSNSIVELPPVCEGSWEDDGPNECDSSCGSDKTKKQKFVKWRQGQSCPNENQVRWVNCNLPECLIGIEEWRNEGSCTEPCGGGIQRKRYVITNINDGNNNQITGLTQGTVEEHYAGKFRTDPCNTQPCPPCEADWSNETQNCYLDGNKNSASIRTCGPNAFKIKTWEVKNHHLGKLNMNTHSCTVKGIGQTEKIPCTDGTPLPNGETFSIRCPLDCIGEWSQWSECALKPNAPQLKAQNKEYCVKSRTYTRTNDYLSIDPNIIWNENTCTSQNGESQTIQCTNNDPTFSNCEILDQCYHKNYYAPDDGRKTYQFRKWGVTLINDTGEDNDGFIKVEWSGARRNSIFPYKWERTMIKGKISLDSILDCSLGNESYLQIRNTNPSRILFELRGDELRKLYDFAYNRAYGWPNVEFYATGGRTLKMRMKNSWKAEHDTNQEWCTFFPDDVIA